MPRIMAAAAPQRRNNGEEKWCVDARNSPRRSRRIW
jgi:hypothetical protein